MHFSKRIPIVEQCMTVTASEEKIDRSADTKYKLFCATKKEKERKPLTMLKGNQKSGGKFAYQIKEEVFYIKKDYKSIRKQQTSNRKVDKEQKQLRIECYKV